MSKQLVRSTSDRILGGVCGGIANFTGANVTIVRIVTAALVVLWGSGLLLYILAWIIIPQEGTGKSGLDSIIASFRGHNPPPPHNPTDLR